MTVEELTAMPLSQLKKNKTTTLCLLSILLSCNALLLLQSLMLESVLLLFVGLGAAITNSALINNYRLYNKLIAARCAKSN